MRDVRELTAEELLSRLDAKEATLILFHRGPDGDAVGSAFALREILTQLGSRAWCVCSNEVPARLRFLSEHMQESVLPESIPADLCPMRIISVDTASPTQLGSLWESFGERIDMMIDHHEKGEPYADVLLRPEAAATAEIIFDLAKQLLADGRIEFTATLCTALYAAISSDTGGFRYSNVTPETHLRAAELVACGIDCADINHRLFETNSLEQLRATAAGISNLRLYADGRIAVILFPYALKAALGLSDEHLDGLVDVARSVAGVQVAISIRQPETKGVFRASMRSSCSYDVSVLCATFGGGGHAKAAGCTITASDAETAAEKLIAAIDPSLL